jgi:hypothetical protein
MRIDIKLDVLPKAFVQIVSETLHANYLLLARLSIQLILFAQPGQPICEIECYSLFRFSFNHQSRSKSSYAVAKSFILCIVPFW